jgi:hypothetical protein
MGRAKCPMRASEAGLAQLVEHLICNQGVGDSSSSTGTSFREVQTAGKALDRPR